MAFIPQPCPPGGGSSTPGRDEEQLLLCDVLPDGTVVGSALSVTSYDEATGLPVGPPTFVIPGTITPYVPQGALQPCPGDTGSVSEFVLCDVQTDNTATQFIRKYLQDATGAVLDTVDFLPDGNPYVPTGTVSDCQPYASCTPDANQDLNADCGPGQSPSQAIIAAEPTTPLSDSVFVDDATADPLCGGTWNRGADPLPPGFPVAESFRNTTFDQPGPVTQGSPATLPFLTAGPPTNDGAGAGWLRLSDGSYASNGIWQVPTPFSTSAGMNAAVTLASHDGTTPGGDGQYFVFTDGAAPLQAAPIGGFGNLGLKNWSGGVFAIVLDEYGQSCTCGQVNDFDPGPCGFCGNTISIQRAGASRIGASCACCTVAQAPLTPKALNLTTRAQPLRLLTSVITEAGQTYVSASIDWNDGNGPVQYFDRVNVTSCITVPPTLRMGLSMNSGGAFQAIKEARDAVARPAGVSNWRAFPITTDPIPACVTLVNVTASVDVTPTDDGTQTAGNNDPEAYFWLVNTATGAIVDADQFSILPSNVGTLKTLTVSASVPPADIPNLRLYVGAESRDDNGEYASTWENLKVDATGTGCPAAQRRTLEISARCPIPVTIVGGGTGDGGGGGTTVVNTPATFEDVPICGSVGGVSQTLFRREVRAADGSITVTFLGAGGLPVNLDGPWQPGECTGSGADDECLADDNGVFFRRTTIDPDGAITITTVDVAGAAYVPVGTITGCSEDRRTLGPVCYSTGGPGGASQGFMTLDPSGNPVLYSLSGAVVPPGYAIVICPLLTQQFTILCDTGNSGHQFQRWYIDSPISGTSDAQWDFELDGSTPYAAVGPVAVCGGGGRDQEIVALCDFQPGGVVTTFLRRYIFDSTTGAIIGTGTSTALDGTTPYVPVGTVGNCSGDENDIVEHILCDQPVGTAFIRRTTFTAGSVVASGNFALNGTTPYVLAGTIGSCASTPGRDTELQLLCDSAATPVRFLRRLVYDATGAFVSRTDTTLDGTTPFVPTGAVGVCTQAVTTDLDFVVTTLCDANGTAFLRRQTFNSTTGAVTATTDTTLGGVAFAPVGAVGLCTNCCAIQIGSGCTSTGSGRYVAIRNADGTISLLDAATGAAVLAANIVACPSDDTVRTLTAQARQLTNAAPWTPGADVVGTLTSLTVTGVSGLWDLVDQNGTALTGLPAGLTLTWSAEDQDILTGPTSVTPQVGASVVANWTMR